MNAYICVTYAQGDRLESDLFCRGLSRYGFRYSCINDMSDPWRRRELVRGGELLLALTSPAAAACETVASDIRQALELGMKVICVSLEAGELEARFCAGAEGGAALIPFPAEDTPDRHGRALFVHRLFVRHLSCLGRCFVESCCTEDEYGRVIRTAVRAHAGQGEACYALGCAYERGEGVPCLEKEAAFWMERAAEADVPDGLIAMGQIRLSGAGGDRDPEEAFRLFSRAADMGDIRGVYHGGLCYLEGAGVVKDPVYAAERLGIAAEAGYAPALYRLGLLCRDGIGVGTDLRASLRYLYAAYRQDGGTLALYGGEGRRYRCASMRRLRRLRAMTESERICIGGAVDAALPSRRRSMGRTRIRLDDFPEDTWDVTLEELFGGRRGDENDEDGGGTASATRPQTGRPSAGRAPADSSPAYAIAASAAFELGRLLSEGGRGLRPSPTRALVWYRCAARMGHVESLYELGNAYRRGAGAPAVPVRAAALFRLAADAGHIPAQFAFGVCCEQGIGMQTNASLAVRYYEQAADAGYAPAQNNLGGCYEHGIGVVQNILTAVEWYAAAAREGQPDAICRLGVCYETGRGVAADGEKAVRLYREAARGRHPYACYRLALCYDRGIHTEEDEGEVMMTVSGVSGVSGATGASGAADAMAVVTDAGEESAAEYDFLGEVEEQGSASRLSAAHKATVRENAADRFTPDRARAMTLYRRAARGGEAYGAYALYLCHRMERGAYRDPAAELDYLKQAREGGCLQAAYELGLCYMDGVGTPVDRREAVACFSYAAELWRAYTRDAHWYARAMTSEGLPPDGLSLKIAAGGALYMLGYCALYGLDGGSGTGGEDLTLRPSEERLEDAVKLFREAADIRHVGALVMLGDLYAYGLLRSGAGDAEDEAVEYYLEAAHMEKDTYTRGIARREQTDNAVDARLSLAHKALSVAREETTDEGTAEMARVNAWRSFSDSAERGSMDALVGMAECLFHGYGAPQNPTAALRLLRMAEQGKGGRVIASLWLGDALRSRWGEVPSPDEADRVYLQGLQRPYLESECGLHTMGLRRMRRREADVRAHTEILYRLATLRAVYFSDASGYRESFPYLARAVLMGHQGAAEDLARMFDYEMSRPKGIPVKAKREGRGGDKTSGSHARLRRRLREKQSTLTRGNRAQWVHRSWMTDYYQALWPEPVPFAYEMRPTTIPSDRPAFVTVPVTRLMRVNALQYLGECFFEGYGLPADPAAAVTCYRRVLETAGTEVDAASVTEAAYSLGWCLLYGVGAAADYPAAIRLLTRASRHHGGACYTLGICHEEGRGVVAADDREALRFYRKAQKMGHPGASQKIAKLEKRVSARQEAAL